MHQLTLHCIIQLTEIPVSYIASYACLYTTPIAVGILIVTYISHIYGMVSHSFLCTCSYGMALILYKQASGITHVCIKTCIT